MVDNQKLKLHSPMQQRWKPVGQLALVIGIIGPVGIPQGSQNSHIFTFFG